jgi:thiol-disulfide isomerase/thioredoxin
LEIGNFLEMPSSSRTPLLIVGGGLLIGLAMGAIVFFGLPPSGGPGGSAPGAGTPEVLGAAPVVGATAPEFTLTDIRGEPVSLSSTLRQPVLINFWATWCGPCRVEMPLIEAQYQANKDKGFRVYAVDFDEPQEVVADFVSAFGLTFDVLLDPGGLVNDLYKVQAYPTSYFVGADGVIKVVHIGQMTETQLDDYMTRLLQ